MAAHAELRPIQRQWDASGHEYDDGVLRQALVGRRAGREQGRRSGGGRRRAALVLCSSCVLAARLWLQLCADFLNYTQMHRPSTATQSVPHCLLQLAKQAADLRQAQREGWIPPQAGLGTLLPCFAPADGRSEGVSEGRPGRTYSTATSGLSAMDTDEGSGELAAAAAAALASQEERAAAEAAAAAARQARREQRRAEKEARRQKLLHVRGWEGA